MRNLTLAILCVALCQLGAVQTGETKSSVGLSPSKWGDELVQFLAKNKSSKNQSKGLAGKKGEGQDKKSSSQSSSAAGANASAGVAPGGSSRGMTEGISSPTGILGAKNSLAVRPTKIVMAASSPRLTHATPALANAAVKNPTFAKSAVTQTAFIPPPAPRIALPQIRQEIQKILDLNKRIRNIQGGSVLQFRKIQEQARIHQKILNEIEGSQKSELGAKTPDKETLLAQEKLRIIHEESKRDATMMGAVPSVPAPNPKVVAQVKTPSVEEPLNPDESAAEDTDKTASI